MQLSSCVSPTLGDGIGGLASLPEPGALRQLSGQLGQVLPSVLLLWEVRAGLVLGLFGCLGPRRQSVDGSG